MAKINLTISFDEEKMAALDFSLRKENTTAQRSMEQALQELYEKTVAQPLREYLDSKTAPTAKPRRPVKSAASKQPTTAVKPTCGVTAPRKENETNG
ncbi:DUF6103 family protein [Oscillibacter sp.]|uniref:DUF6103 family protein n=1 Tax=Oscillibacter sp. TaxID=1945593 RepID=UPI0028AF38C4|nr:DUF6103 family protein [Oscillibacter sp.]